MPLEPPVGAPPHPTHTRLPGPEPVTGYARATDPGGGAAEVRRHLEVLRARWLWVYLSVFLTTSVAIAVTTLVTPQYAAQLRLFVSVAQEAGDVGAAYQGGLLSQQRVLSYAELVSSPTVAADIAARLDLPQSPVELQQQITAEALPNTVLIDVTVVDDSPDRARRIADEIGAVFPDHVHRLEAPAEGEESMVRVRVPEAAHVAPDPVSPKPERDLLLALFLGLLAGVGLAFLREALETSVSDPDLLAAASGLPGLAVLHHEHGERERLLVVDDPASPLAEQFRQLRTQLQFIDIDSPPRSLLVTSARAQEGTSTTACNLAISLAQSGLRVCLVEADLRRPSLGRRLGVDDRLGLTSVLAGQVRLENVTQPWNGALLDVVVAGTVPPNPAELLGSRSMRTTLSRLEERYDLVLLDAPPVLPVTDSVVLSTITSGTLLVVRAGDTTREQVRRAAEQLRGVGARVYGTVLVGQVPGGTRGFRADYGLDVGGRSPRRRHRGGEACSWGG